MRGGVGSRIGRQCAGAQIVELRFEPVHSRARVGSAQHRLTLPVRRPRARPLIWKYVVQGLAGRRMWVGSAARGRGQDAATVITLIFACQQSRCCMTVCHHRGVLRLPETWVETTSERPRVLGDLCQPRPGAALPTRRRLQHNFQAAGLVLANTPERGSPGVSWTVALVNPASASMRRASCSPNAVPNPAPPSASEMVMQMQSAHGVRHRRERIADIVLQIAGQTRLLHDEHATGHERRMDAFQHARQAPRRPGRPLIVEPALTDRG
jgi:hypothetical protein